MKNLQEQIERINRLSNYEVGVVISEQMIKEDNGTTAQTSNPKFNQNELKALKERGFKVDPTNTVATLQMQGKKIEVTKYFQSTTDNVGGYIVKSDGKVVIKKLHDAADTELDKLIGHKLKLAQSSDKGKGVVVGDAGGATA